MTRDLKDEGWVARGFYLSRRDDEELDEVAQRAGVSCGYILRQLVSDFLDRRIKILWPED